jgi:hypothetical protein
MSISEGCATQASARAPLYNSAPEVLVDFRSWYGENLPLLERYFAQLHEEGAGPPDFFEWAVVQHEVELECPQVQLC